MNSRVSKAQTYRSRVKLPKAFQETLDAVVGTSAELPQCHREESLRNGTLSRDATAVQTTKRQLDEASEDLLPAKRARLTQTDVRQLSVEDEEAEQAAETILQQPKPTTLNCRHASFLEDFIDLAAPQSVSTLVTKWLESVGSGQRRCRSDSYLQRSYNNLIPRTITRSAPGMSYPRDHDGFVLPPTPASIRSRSGRDTDAGSVAPSDTSGQSTTRKKLVEDPLYRDLNLAANNIYMCPPRTALPECISGLVDVVRKDRNTPEPSLDQLEQDLDLAALEAVGEPKVEEYFRTNIFHHPQSTDSLKRDDKQPMSKQAVPNAKTKFRVSTPIPDMLYGYNRGAFPQQQAQLISMGKEIVANNQGLIYPFFVVEFKGDGPSGAGSMWVATNQCLGGSTSCVKIAERLNHQLRECKSNMIQPTDSAAFSIAMNGTEARLYISWKHDELSYYMQRIDGFLLYDPEHYLKFRKYVRNIIDWGKDKRLNEIRDSLDCLLEESRKRTSVVAKPRQVLSDGSATITKSSNAQGQSCFADTDDYTTSQDIDEGPALLEDDQQDQSQLLVSFDSAEPASCATSFTSSFTSSFNTKNHKASSKRLRASQSPPVTSYASKKHSSAKHRTGQSTASAEEQTTAAANNYWTWSKSYNQWYHVNEDGSCMWHPRTA